MCIFYFTKIVVSFMVNVESIVCCLSTPCWILVAMYGVKLGSIIICSRRKRFAVAEKDSQSQKKIRNRRKRFAVAENDFQEQKMICRSRKSFAGAEKVFGGEDLER